MPLRQERGPIPVLPIKEPFLGQKSWMYPAVLVKKVDPQYPESAKRSGIQGSVVVHAIIDRHGDVTDAWP